MPVEVSRNTQVRDGEPDGIPRDPAARAIFLDGVAYGYVLGRDVGFREGVTSYAREAVRLIAASAEQGQQVSPTA